VRAGFYGRHGGRIPCCGILDAWKYRRDFGGRCWTRVAMDKDFAAFLGWFGIQRYWRLVDWGETHTLQRLRLSGAEWPDSVLLCRIGRLLPLGGFGGLWRPCAWVVGFQDMFSLKGSVVTCVQHLVVVLFWVVKITPFLSMARNAKLCFFVKKLNKIVKWWKWPKHVIFTCQISTFYKILVVNVLKLRPKLCVRKELLL
jgi:hypothetical protein